MSEPHFPTSLLSLRLSVVSPENFDNPTPDSKFSGLGSESTGKRSGKPSKGGDKPSKGGDKPSKGGDKPSTCGDKRSKGDEGKSSENCKPCIHDIIEDLIDITPDTSKYIYYCNKCYMCFQSNVDGRTST